MDDVDLAGFGFVVSDDCEKNPETIMHEIISEINQILFLITNFHINPLIQDEPIFI